MNKLLFKIFFSFLTIAACTSAKKQQSPINIKQGIDGYVYKISGNQMPAPNVAPAKPIAIATTVYIYEATNLKDVARIGYSSTYSSINKKLITTVQSDSTGHFAISLPVGSYSLFIKTNNLFYANLFDVNNNISLVAVTENTVSHVEIKESSSATF